MGRHELRDAAGEPVFGEAAKFSGGGGRHSKDVIEAPTERILTGTIEWITTPSAELHKLGDTQPIPIVDMEAEKRRAADIALQRPNHGTAPNEGAGTWKPPMTYEELEWLLQKMRRKWNL